MRGTTREHVRAKRVNEPFSCLLAITGCRYGLARMFHEGGVAALVEATDTLSTQAVETMTRPGPHSTE